LIATLPKCQSSILMQLCTSHSPLNQHLHRIGKTVSSNCMYYPEMRETVHHFLLDCPHYVRERHVLSSLHIGP
ncbi:hypothetical protein BDR04DRAFT_1026928, partial [Suillus decipiens]